MTHLLNELNTIDWFTETGVRKPKISIITVVFNNRSSIERAIKSVLGQTYGNIEYIVIDGASTDGTLEVINRYSDKIDVSVSEKDYGVYHAMNKGIENASGDIIGFLHSDDVFANNDILSDIAKSFEEHDIDLLYGNLEYLRKKQDIVFRYWKAGKFEKSMLTYGWMPPHPTVYLKNEIFKKVGVFDTNYKISGDYDLMLRILKMPAIKVFYLDKVIVRMKMGGISNRGMMNLINKTAEDYRAIKANNIGGITTLLFKNLTKVQQLYNREK